METVRSVRVERGLPLGDGLKVLEHENLGSTVFNVLCEGLAKGQFKPNDRLRIRDIAEQLGTSVTPVRDAILRLVQDQALVLRSARDIRVPVLTQETYLEIRAIRIKLEGLAAEVAATSATPDQISRLETIVRQNEQALREADGTRATELNQIFHFELATLAGMPLLTGILRRLWLIMGPAIADIYSEAGRDMIDYHYPVLEAIKAHNGDLAAQAIAEDIVKGGHAILQRVATRSG